MKLNLDFALYKGKTRLRDWWKAVKAHFTAVQDAVNELDKANTDLAQTIEDEAEARKNADDNLKEAIEDEVL